MIHKKTLAALEKVIMALAPLDPESRRQVIVATHNLIEIGMGRQGEDRPQPKSKPKNKPAKRKR